MIRIKLRSSVYVVSAMSVMLAGCGGSGSSGGDTPASVSTYTGVVLDGPLQGASVFADINRNGVKDPGEPVTTTDANGKYTLQMSRDIFQPPVIVEVLPSTVDADTGKAVGKFYRMEAPDGVYSVINPITSMIKAVMLVNPGLKRTEAESIVRGYLNLSDTYEIYADYTITERPGGVSEDKWKRFLSESGRVHNIARIAAATMADYWERASKAYGGSIPADKVAQVQSVLVEATLKSVAPMAGRVPNDGLVDLSTLVISDPGFSADQIDARLRQMAVGANASLSKIIGEGAVHMIPFKDAHGNYAHFVMRDGGSNNFTGQAVSGMSTVIQSDFSEAENRSMRALGSTDSVFDGSLRYDSTTGEDILGTTVNAFRWRLAKLPTAGEKMRSTIDARWLNNENAVWPNGAQIYRGLVKVGASGLLAYIKDSAQYKDGLLPDSLVSLYGENSASGFRLGNLGVRFKSGDFGSQFGGTTSLQSLANGVVNLPQAGRWDVRRNFAGQTYVTLTVPADYQPDIADQLKDRLFSNLSTPSSALIQISTTQYTLGWYVPEGRYAELMLLNDAAFNALKANLKW